MKEEQNLPRPIYQAPLTTDELLVLARITVMWGQLDLHVDEILISVYGIGQDHFNHLFTGKTLKPKVEAILAAIESCRTENSKELVKNMCNDILVCIPDRNLATHGLWGSYWDDEKSVWRSAAGNVQKKRFFFSSEIPELYNKVLKACASADAAYYSEVKREPQPLNMNRIVVFSRLPPHETQHPPPRFPL